MELKERSYNTKIFRPKPVIRWELDQQLLMIATNWGSSDSVQKILDEIAKYVTAAQGDVEVTTPFAVLPQLTSQANSLRIATLLANEITFRTDNRNEFTAGIEICLILKTKNQLSWLQVGQPHLYYQRKNSLPQPLSMVPDLSFDIILGDESTSPLPKDLIGIESILSPSTGHCLIQPGDQLLLVSRSEVPVQLTNQPLSSESLSDLTLSLSEKKPESPFWLGLVTL